MFEVDTVHSLGCNIGAVLTEFSAFSISCKQLCCLTFATTDACTIEIINMGKQKYFSALNFLRICLVYTTTVCT